MMYWYGGYGLGWLNMIWMLIFWVGIIWLIVWGIQKVSNREEDALGILEKRYVKGEINKKQYLEMKQTLRK